MAFGPGASIWSACLVQFGEDTDGKDDDLVHHVEPRISILMDVVLRRQRTGNRGCDSWSLLDVLPLPRS